MATNPDPSDRPRSPDRLSDFLRYVVTAFGDEGRGDAELLARFVEDNDQEAFRALVARYGRSVWAICLGVLGDRHDAEDAFQATFLALARYAKTIGAKRGLGPWVRSAARNAASKVRRGARRLDRLRDRFAADAPARSPGEVPAIDEGSTWVLAAEELERLPRRLRDTVALYHLEGRTLAQVAEAVGCSVTEVRRRLNTGVARLRSQLSARGVVLTASVLAAIPAGLAQSTAAAAAVARGGAIPSARVAALTEAILAPTVPAWVAKLGMALVVVTGTAIALVAGPAPTPLQDPPAAELKPNPPSAPPVEPAGTRRATATLSGRVTDAAGNPVVGASVAALVRRPWTPTDCGLRDDVVARATTDGQGWYTVTVPADFPTHFPERSVTLLVSGRGLPPTTKVVRLGAGGADVGVPAPRAVAGVLIGPSGEVASGVKVGVVRLGHAAAEPLQGQERTTPSGWPVDAVSAPDGTFRFTGLPAGEDVWVEVRDDRFALTTVRIAASDPGPVRVALAAPRVLEGRVTASDTGKPLTGARVSVFLGPWETSPRYTAVTTTAETAVNAVPVEFDTLTGPDGSFRFRLPPVPAYRFYVLPPAGAAYLPLGRVIDWKADRAVHELVLALPPGEVLRGVLRDGEGKPVADGWVTYEPRSGNRHVPKDMLTGRDAVVRTAGDGSFRIAVPPGAGRVSVFGPHANFLPHSYELLRCRSCGTNHLRNFEHARVEFDAAPGAAPEPLALTVRTGVTVPGRAVGPNGEPIANGVLVCRSVVHPLRNLVTRPVAIRAGAFELPGCSPGRVYPVILLDAGRRLGAVAELRVGGAAPEVRLDPCGSAEVRLVDPAGRPLAGVASVLGLSLDCDRAADAPPPAKPGTGGMEQSWFDPRHHLPGPATDADGRVTLRALVPGVEYGVRFQVGGRGYSSAAFRVKPGQVTGLPDVVAGQVKPPEPGPPEDEALDER